jgi:hypothetical protein
VTSVFENLSEQQEQRLVEFCDPKRDHSQCNQPQWPEGGEFLPKGASPPDPKVLAQFVLAFNSPDESAPGMPTAVLKALAS